MYYYDVYNNYDSRVDKENVGVCSPKGDHNNAAWDTEVILVPICIKASKEVKEKEKVCVWGGPKHAYTFCCSIHACFDTAKVTVMGREGIFKTRFLFPFCLCNKHACGLFLLFECHFGNPFSASFIAIYPMRACWCSLPNNSIFFLAQKVTS